jgi:hypothetical protein
MWSMVGRTLILVAAVTSVCTTASAGESVTFRGTGTYVVVRTVLPMANGGAAVHLVNDTVATIAPSEIGFIFGDCAGLAYLSPTGKVDTNTYCTFSETAEDSFDAHGQGDGTEGKIEIIGGSGKWTGATGTGTIKRKWAQDNRGTYEYEFTISTP